MINISIRHGRPQTICGVEGGGEGGARGVVVKHQAPNGEVSGSICVVS